MFMKKEEHSQMKNDQELISLFINRNEMAIKTTATEYEKYLFKISYNILKNKEDVEECVNDTFLKAWETIPPQIPTSLKAYLSAIIRNISLDYYRKQHSAKRNKEFQVLLDECGSCLPFTNNLEEDFESFVLSQSISDYLMTLEEEKKYLFVRRYYHGDTIKELAEKRNLSQSNVKIKLYRMRNELKKKLKNGG